MNRRSRQILLGITLGACVSVAAIAAVAALGSSTQTRQTAPAANLAGGFSAVADQSLPAAPAAVASQFADIHTGISAPRQVGTHAYIASYGGAVCAVFNPGSGGCTDTLDHGVWLFGDMIRASDSEQAPFDLNIYGLAEDGVSSVTVSFADGTTTIPVVNNAFWATFGNATFSQIQAITVGSSAGQAALDPARYFSTPNQTAP